MLDYIDPAVLPMGIFLLACSTVGILGNILIILCTVKTKRFRSPCHILICLSCLADIFHLSGHIPFCIHLFGNLSSTQSECYFMQILSILGLTITGPLILAMGIDRLIAIRFPMAYRYYNNHSKSYLSIQLLFPIIYSTFFLIYGALEVNSNHEDQIICELRLALNGHSLRLFIHSNGIILIFVFLVYLAVFIILKKNRAIMLIVLTGTKFRSVFRSIAIIVVFLLCGWMATMISSIVVFASQLNPKKFHVYGMYTGIPVNLATASNILIFYITNSEYRRVIKSIILCGRKVHSSPDRFSSQNRRNSIDRTSRGHRGSVKTLPKLDK